MTCCILELPIHQRYSNLPCHLTKVPHFQVDRCCSKGGSYLQQDHPPDLHQGYSFHLAIWETRVLALIPFGNPLHSRWLSCAFHLQWCTGITCTSFCTTIPSLCNPMFTYLSKVTASVHHSFFPYLSLVITVYWRWVAGCQAKNTLSGYIKQALAKGSRNLSFQWGIKSTVCVKFNERW